MQFGFVSLIDALGFRGIWSKYPEKDIVARMMSVRKAIHEYASSNEAAARWYNFRPPKIQIQFLSDALFLGVFAKDETIVDHPFYGRAGKPLRISRRGWALEALLGATQEAIRAAAGDSIFAKVNSDNFDRMMSGPRIPYRGVVTAGEFIRRKEFILGPAIDEAAELHQQADGAFVFLTPSATAHFNQLPEGLGPDRYALQWEVPLRSGESVSTRVVRPVRSRLIPPDEEGFAKLLLDHLGGTEGSAEARKLKNTAKFYAYCLDIFSVAPSNEEGSMREHINKVLAIQTKQEADERLKRNGY